MLRLAGQMVVIVVVSALIGFGIARQLSNDHLLEVQQCARQVTEKYLYNPILEFIQAETPTALAKARAKARLTINGKSLTDRIARQCTDV